MDYNKVLNSRIVEVKPSGIRKFFDIAEQMEDVISLGVGEPDCGERTIINVKKISPTPGKYPRPSAKMAKNPIK